HWTCLVDTNQPDMKASEQFGFGDHYTVTARSLLLFEQQQRASSDGVVITKTKLLTGFHVWLIGIDQAGPVL
ncbi:hypothetical protein QCD79_34610, partial [Pseudomonas quasicaspiana]|nr:hypothetical protein [Pseudomonas quasicaspiana]